MCQIGRYCLFGLLLITSTLGFGQQYHTTFYITKAPDAPQIDGEADDKCWLRTAWHPINHLWAGTMPSKTDYQGRYKVMWRADGLYILAEIEDDTLTDTHADLLDHYWDDDCLEVFVDEDASGGNHQYSHQAFAYHMDLSGKSLDMDEDQKPVDFSAHVEQTHKTHGTKTIWEAHINIYPKTYKTGGKNSTEKLHSGQTVGFAIAYCDNDHSAERESFVGSMPIGGTDKNRAWIDASLFTKWELK